MFGQDNGRRLSILLATIFIAGPIFMALMPGNDVAAQKVIGTVATTKEGWNGLDFVWDTNVVARPFTMNLSISKYWNIDNATVGVSGAPFITDPGTQWEEMNFPERPRLDVGRNGDDWVWEGPLGHQMQFTGEQDAVTLELKTNATSTLSIPLPAGASIKDITFDVNSTQQKGAYEYTITIGNISTPVWHKESMDFAKGPSILTKAQDSSDLVGINSVCVEHLDLVGEPYKDIMAAGTGDHLFIAKHDGSQPSGFSQSPLVQILGNGTKTGDLLDCAVGDFNKDEMADLAISTSDGNIYVLKNDGTGDFQLPAYTIKINATRVDSVTLGDVNGDGWGDVVGGTMDGKFEISTWDPVKSSFKAPIEIKAGTGSVNGLAIWDMNYDHRNEIIGANENRHWYILSNNGSGWQLASPVSCGGDDLTSLAVGNLNKDGWPDLISSGVDGSFYVSYNYFGSYLKGQIIRGGPQTMKDLAISDIDNDGDLDVLGLNGDGWVYLSRNDNGFLDDAVPIIHVGVNQSTIAVADMDNDNHPDLVLGGKNGITIYWNTYGPFEETLGKTDGGLLKSEVQTYLDSFNPDADDIDHYGNIMSMVPFNIHSEFPGNLTFDHVNVTYDFERIVDIKTALQLYVKANSDKANFEGFVDVPVQFLTDSVGTLRIAKISISYDADLIAIIHSPAKGARYNLSDQILFKGNSDFDPYCALPGYQYTWMVDGRVVGSGCEFKSSVMEKVGSEGKHKVRLMVQKLSIQEIVYSEVEITVRPPTPPVVTVPQNAEVKTGKPLQVKVQAHDTDPLDDANLRYTLWSGPKGMTINNTTGWIDWTPGKDDTGNHSVVVQVSDGKNVTMATFYIKVDKGPSPVAVNPYFAWPVILTIVIVGLAFGVVFVETEVGIFALYSLGFLLYTRLKQEMVLDNFVRGQIYGHICENPGLHLAEIQRKLKISAGTLIYHLKTLEREGLVKSFPNGSLRVFFSSSVKVPKELMSLTKAQRWILKAIEERPGVSQKELSEGTGLSDSTVNRIVHDLEERGMVRIEKGKTTQCFIVDN